MILGPVGGFTDPENDFSTVVVYDHLQCNTLVLCTEVSIFSEKET